MKRLKAWNYKSPSEIKLTQTIDIQNITIIILDLSQMVITD
jgi:hypothetical protein